MKNAAWKIVTAVGALVFAITGAGSLISVRPPLSMAVRGFVTNRYTFFTGEYVCAVMSVTNTSKGDTFICMSRGAHQPVNGVVVFAGPLQEGSKKDYYAFREGDFQMRTLPPHSGFSFEAVIGRELTNETVLDVMQFPSTAWPYRYLPKSISRKLPEFFYRKPKAYVLTPTALTECKLSP